MLFDVVFFALTPAEQKKDLLRQTDIHDRQTDRTDGQTYLTGCCEDLPEIVTLDKELVLGFGPGHGVVHLDDGPIDGGQSLDDDGSDLLLDELELVVERRLGTDSGIHGDQTLRDDFAVLGFDLGKNKFV